MFFNDLLTIYHSFRSRGPCQPPFCQSPPPFHASPPTFPQLLALSLFSYVQLLRSELPPESFPFVVFVLCQPFPDDPPAVVALPHDFPPCSEWFGFAVPPDGGFGLPTGAASRFPNRMRISIKRGA